MNTDCAFTIGKTHAVCQDYAVAGGPDGGYAILSDGCSSSPDTDIGSRLLVKSAERLLQTSELVCEEGVRVWHGRAAESALAHASFINLKQESLDATLMTISAGNGRFIVGCSGDGVVALKSRDGDLDVYSISFTAGYPRYPSYASQPDRLGGFERLENNIKEVTHYQMLSGPQGLVELRRYASSDSTELFTGYNDEYQFVAVFSDGIHSFVEVANTRTNKSVARVGLERLLPELLSFKGFAGAFVRRRLNRFLEMCQAKNWRHQDDLSVGVVYMGERSHPDWTKEMSDEL
jgi:hypothetical protein